MTEPSEDRELGCITLIVLFIMCSMLCTAIKGYWHYQDRAATALERIADSLEGALPAKAEIEEDAK